MVRPGKEIFFEKKLLLNKSIKVTFSNGRSKLIRLSYMCFTVQWHFSLNFTGGSIRSSFPSWVCDPQTFQGAGFVDPIAGEGMGINWRRAALLPRGDQRLAGGHRTQEREQQSPVAGVVIPASF